jgi:hypothetical protein
MNQQMVDDGLESAQELSHQARNIAQQMAAAQVAAARAIFNLTNICSLGSLTPLAIRFEEGLGLYTRTLDQVQDTTQQAIDKQATQYRDIAKQGDSWVAQGQQQQSEKKQGGDKSDASRLYEHQH